MVKDAVQPKTNTPRPPLPHKSFNPHLLLPEGLKIPAVKYQIITREGQEIVVGRVKIQTPNNGHAFILRRFDTGAVSLTTMFRAAFPSAEDECEKQESSWVKANFDLTGANGGAGKDALRLAGTWVNPKVAATIAPDYRLEEVIQPLVNASPDPMQDYRRSTKPASPHVNGSSSPAKGATTRNESDNRTSPSPGTPLAKRRKEQTASPAKTELTVAPRRSGRTPSPAPATAAVKETTTTTRASRSKAVKTPRSPTKATTVGRASGRLTPVEPDQEGEDVADVPGPDMQEDIKEQQEMIARLKAEREVANVSAIPIKQSDSQASKRVREDEDKSLQLNFREPEEHLPVEKREIKSNKRLKLQPQQKSAVWGAFLFAAGLAAAATIPSLLL